MQIRSIQCSWSSLPWSDAPGTEPPVFSPAGGTVGLILFLSSHFQFQSVAQITTGMLVKKI